MNLRAKLFLDYYFGGFLHAVLRVPTILLGKLLRRNHDLSKCREIAILKLLGGGSLVIAYPALLALRRLPGLQKLTLITTPAIRPFGDLLGIFDEIVVVRDDRGLLALAADSVRAFRKFFRHDALIDLEIHSRLTTVFALLTAARNRIGFFTNISFWRRHLNTHLLFCNITNGIYDFYDQLATLFGTSPVDSGECEREFRSRLGEYGFEGDLFRLAIAPACSGLSRERMLRREEWVEVLAQRIARCGQAMVEVHLLGGPADRVELEQMATLLEARFRGRATMHNHAGKASLKESVRIIAAMDEVLCIDSALLHFSRLLGRQTVSFWGPTDPRTLIRPNPRGLDEIHYVKIPCSPCVHMSHQPPCKGQNICMRLAVDPAAPVPRNQPWVLRG
ncbi:MAG: glycosyltransferase family 9 protein [Bryobacteraceae bacterium]